MGYMIRKKTQSLQGVFIYWRRSNVVMKTTFLLYGKIGWKKCITKCRLNFMIDVCSHLHCIASNFFSYWENMKWYANAEFYQNQQMRSFWYVFFLGKFQYLVASHRSILSKVCMTKILLLVICILPSTYLVHIFNSQSLHTGGNWKRKWYKSQCRKEIRLICQNHVSRTSTKL